MIVKKCYCDICDRQILDKHCSQISICRKKIDEGITYDLHEWEACGDCCSKIEKLIYETRFKDVVCDEEVSLKEAYDALDTLTTYLYNNEDEINSGESYYQDKDGYRFSCDSGYFFGGLEETKKYLCAKMKQKI